MIVSVDKGNRTMKKIAEILQRDEFASWKDSIDKTNHLSDLFILWQNA